MIPTVRREPMLKRPHAVCVVLALAGGKRKVEAWMTPQEARDLAGKLNVAAADARCEAIIAEEPR